MPLRIRNTQDAAKEKLSEQVIALDEKLLKVKGNINPRWTSSIYPIK